MNLYASADSAQRRRIDPTLAYNWKICAFDCLIKSLRTGSELLLVVVKEKNTKAGRQVSVWGFL